MMSDLIVEQEKNNLDVKSLDGRRNIIHKY